VRYREEVREELDAEEAALAAEREASGQEPPSARRTAASSDTAQDPEPPTR
jgi:hypothetical protein